MLIAENLFLLFTTEKGTRRRGITNLNVAVSAGLLCDLILGGYADVVEGRVLRKTRVHAASPAPAAGEEPGIVISAYEALVEHPDISIDRLIGAKWFANWEKIGCALAERDIVAKKTSSFLGLKRTIFPVVDRQVEAQLRTQLANAIKGNTVADVPQAVTLAIFDKVGNVKSELESELGALSKRAVRKRIEELHKRYVNSASEPAIKAVGRAVDAAVAAVIAVTAATAANASQ